MFAKTYLLREAPGATPQVIYDRYTALRGDPSHIRGQNYLFMHATKFFGGGPMELKEAEGEDYGEVPNNCKLSYHVTFHKFVQHSICY